MERRAGNLNENKRLTRAQGKTSQITSKILNNSQSKTNKSNASPSPPKNTSYISIQYESDDDSINKNKDTAENVVVKLRNKLADTISENENLRSKIDKVRERSRRLKK